MRLFRLMIYVENKENLTYIVSTTTTTTTKNRETRTTGAIVSRGHKYFADTKKKHNEKLVLICQPSLYLQPPRRGPSPKLWTFPAGCLGDGWQKIKKNKVFRVLVIWVNHLIANCVCVCNKYFVASTAQRAKYSIRYRLIEGKTRKGLMLEGTNSRCPIFYYYYYYFFLPKLAG